MHGVSELILVCCILALAASNEQLLSPSSGSIINSNSSVTSEEKLSIFSDTNIQSGNLTASSINKSENEINREDVHDLEFESSYESRSELNITNNTFQPNAIDASSNSIQTGQSMQDQKTDISSFTQKLLDLFGNLLFNTVLPYLSFDILSTNGQDDLTSVGSTSSMNFSPSSINTSEGMESVPNNSGFPASATQLNSGQNTLCPNQSQNLKVNIICFSGLTYSIDPEGKDFTPPDVQVSAGKFHFIQMINEFIGIWDKNGTKQTSNSAINFFNISAFVSNIKATSDPNLIYDYDNDRWYVSFMVVNGSHTNERNVFIASSLKNDPYHWNYNVIEMNGKSHDKCIDRPNIAVGKDKFLISVNLYSSINGLCTIDEKARENGYFLKINGFEIVIGNKENIGAKSTNLNVVHLALSPSLSFSYKPVKSYVDDGVFRLVSTNEAHSTTIKLLSISENSTFREDFKLPRTNYKLMGQTFMPWFAIQKGSDRYIDNGDARIQDAVYTEGEIWSVLNESCKTKLDDNTQNAHSCVRVITIDPNHTKPKPDCVVNRNTDTLRDFTFGHKDTYYYYPTIQANKFKDIFVFYGFSSAYDFPSLQLTKIKETDPCNIQLMTIPMKIGGHPANDTESNNKCKFYDESRSCNRMGDYMSSALDPADRSSIWVSGQYYDTNAFSTLIAKISPT